MTSILERWWNTYRDDLWMIPPTAFTGVPSPRDFIEDSQREDKTVEVRDNTFTATIKKRTISMPYKVCAGFIIIDLRKLKRPIMTTLKLYMQTCCQSVSLNKPRVIIFINLSSQDTRRVLSLVESYTGSTRFIYLYRSRVNMHPLLETKCQVFHLRGLVRHGFQTTRVDKLLRTLASIRTRAAAAAFVKEAMQVACDLYYTLDRLVACLGRRLLIVVKDNKTRLVLVSALSACSSDIKKVRNNETFALFKLASTVHDKLTLPSQ